MNIAMARTAKQIQGDIYSLLRRDIDDIISGSVYRAGFRPRDSRLEDAVVTFTTGLADEIQTGVVTVDVYVPDIDPYADGVLVEDAGRTAALEHLLSVWTANLNRERTDYLFSLMQTIYTEAEPSILQHFVVVKIKYQLFDNQ